MRVPAKKREMPMRPGPELHKNCARMSSATMRAATENIKRDRIGRSGHLRPCLRQVTTITDVVRALISPENQHAAADCEQCTSTEDGKKLALVMACSPTSVVSPSQITRNCALAAPIRMS